MQLKRLSILGLGLIGGSVGLAVKAIIKDCQIIGYDVSSDAALEALSRRAVDRVETSILSAARGAQIALLAASPVQNEAILNDIAGAVPREAVVTDVGSTKRSIVGMADRLKVRFVGSHPMAGGEKGGIESARDDLFREAVCIMTPTPQTDPASIELVEQLWRAMGMKTTRCSPEEHDRLAAAISHLPHALAAALVRTQSEASLALAGRGFLDATRIAAGNPALWTEIFSQNSDNLMAMIDQFAGELDVLKAALRSNRADMIQSWLDFAAQRRRLR